MIKLSKSTTSKRIFIWNAIGSGCNAFSTVIILMIINRVFGQAEGGIATISLALAQQMLTISNFETATHYITDSKKEVGFDVHFGTKTILFIIAIISSCVIALYKYDFYKAAVVICFCIYKCTDGFATLSTGVLQRIGRLDLAGMSLTVKTLAAIIMLIAVSVLSGNLLLASGMVAVCAVLWTVFVDMALIASFLPLEINFSIKKIKTLVLDCLPLFLTTFLFTYIINQPKYVIDSLLSEEQQNAFGIIFMPASVIAMLSLFIYRPLLTTLTSYWAENNTKSFLGMVAKISLILLGLTVLCLAGCATVGIPILSLLFKVDLAGLTTELCLIIIGGGLYAFSTLIYNMLAIFRKQKIMLAACAVVYVFAIIITKPLIIGAKLNGAALSYVLSNLLLSILLLSCCMFTIKKKGDCDNGKG